MSSSGQPVTYLVREKQVQSHPNCLCVIQMSVANIMLVVKNPLTLLKLWDCGWYFDTVNVGNMASGVNTKQVKRTVHVSPQDIDNFHELAKRGVKFTAQMTPGEEFGDFIEALDR